MGMAYKSRKVWESIWWNTGEQFLTVDVVSTKTDHAHGYLIRVVSHHRLYSADGEVLVSNAVAKRDEAWRRFIALCADYNEKYRIAGVI